MDDKPRHECSLDNWDLASPAAAYVGTVSDSVSVSGSRVGSAAYAKSVSDAAAAADTWGSCVGLVTWDAMTTSDSAAPILATSNGSLPEAT